MQDAIPFQTAYLAGYVADKYDVSAEDSIERANKRIRRSTEETFQQTVTGYDSVKWITAASSCTAARQSMRCSRSGC